MPPRNFNLILFAVVISILCHATYRNARTASILGEAIELIEQNYVDPVDREELLSAAMEGVVGKLDEHSSYFAVDAYETFQDVMQQEFAGIGILIDQLDEDQPVRVVTPLVNSPALKAGLLPNDLIVEVDGADVRTLPLEKVSDRLKGTPGTSVSLVVARGENELSVSVRRATIELESVVGDHRDESNRWVYRIKCQPSIAYMRLKSFGEKTVRELEKVLRELDNDFDALVLDLRGNGGGLLYAARDVSDMFLSEGKIVSTRIRGGKIEDSYSATPGTLVDPSKPVAVLIDGESASASEIVAACLQDNGRALIAGMRSYGKGTVQEVMPLQFGRSALRLTVARYYRPNNKNIHRNKDATEDEVWGVTPDKGFVVPMTMEQIGKLLMSWRDASFPMLAGIDPPEIDVPATGRETPDETEESETESQDPLETEFLNADRLRTQTLEPSEAAKANISQGPAEISYDPPLRAVVGRLLQKTGGGQAADPGGEDSGDAAESRQSDDESGKKNAA